MNWILFSSFLACLNVAQGCHQKQGNFPPNISLATENKTNPLEVRRVQVRTLKQDVDNDYPYSYYDKEEDTDYHYPSEKEIYFKPKIVSNATTFYLKRPGTLIKLPCQLATLPSSVVLKWSKVDSKNPHNMIALGTTIMDKTGVKYQVEVTETGSTLFILLADREDEGQYKCDFMTGVEGEHLVTHAIKLAAIERRNLSLSGLHLDQKTTDIEQTAATDPSEKQITDNEKDKEKDNEMDIDFGIEYFNASIFATNILANEEDDEDEEITKMDQNANSDPPIKENGDNEKDKENINETNKDYGIDYIDTVAIFAVDNEENDENEEAMEIEKTTNTISSEKENRVSEKSEEKKGEHVIESLECSDLWSGYKCGASSWINNSEDITIPLVLGISGCIVILLLVVMPVILYVRNKKQKKMPNYNIDLFINRRYHV